jgi:hypothetical protein
MSPFSAPFSGAPKSEGFCFQSERLLYGREPKCCSGQNRESRGREAAGRRNQPEEVVQEKECRKRPAYRTRQTIDARGTNRRQRKATVSRQLTPYPDGEQRESTYVTTVPPKWPMTAWGTACGDYFRVTIRKLARPLNTSAFVGTNRKSRHNSRLMSDLACME